MLKEKIRVIRCFSYVKSQNENFSCFVRISEIFHPSKNVKNSNFLTTKRKKSTYDQAIYMISYKLTRIRIKQEESSTVKKPKSSVWTSIDKSRKNDLTPKVQGINVQSTNTATYYLFYYHGIVQRIML